ncbi:LCP family protein [Nocardiopsis mangrovi]|uniref:LCP family protein n=1 Tax=Nocardiopsis mangrovi TaxID=1179818 RepID=A0ABV9DQX5_9ACTN
MPRNRSSRGSAKARAARKNLSRGGWAAVITTGIVICSSLTAYGAYYDIYGNISQQSIDTDAFGDRPSRVDGALNIMVIGSDVRTGENADLGGEAEGERPDSLIIAHISPDKGTATLINLPRDTMVDLPGCPATDDGEYQGMSAQRGMINSAMTFGGVQCQWAVVEQITGIHIDHFVSVDFTGFRDIVDSIGGVQMCVPEPINDEKAHLELDAGEQVLNGEQSLGYMRSRYSQGDGSDTSRIGRQQEFLGAMFSQVMSGEILRSPTNLYDFLGSVTNTITTDDGLTVDTMADIAIAMREVDMSDVKFVTAPNGADPADENRLVLSEPDATQLFDAIAQDTALPGEEEEDDSGEGGGGSDSGEDDAPAVEPGDVSVDVRNGTGVTGAADQVATVLANEGFQVADTGNPDGPVPAQTTVYYGPGQEGHAQALADKLEAGTIEENPALGSSAVQLVMASDWAGVKISGGNGGGGVASTSAADGEAKAEC